MEDLWEKFGMSVVALAIVAVATLTFFAIKSDGAVDYCYIEASSMTDVPRVFYHLHGHRPWRTDNKIGTFESFDEARTAAEKMACPLHR